MSDVNAFMSAIARCCVDYVAQFSILAYSVMFAYENKNYCVYTRVQYKPLSCRILIVFDNAFNNLIVWMFYVFV